MNRRERTNYDTNPFANLMQTPYVSQRVQFPFEDYMRTLQTVDQNREKALAQQDQLDLIFANMETVPGDITAKNKLEAEKENTRAALEGLNFADPANQDKLRVVAKNVVTSPILKQISTFTKAYNEDAAQRAQAEKTLGKSGIVEISPTTMNAFNESGNTEFKSGWEKKGDWEGVSSKIINEFYNDVSETINLDELNKTSGSTPYLGTKSNTTEGYNALPIKKAQEKFEVAYNKWTNTSEYQQQLNARKYSEGKTMEEIQGEMRNEFEDQAKAMSKTKVNMGVIGNALFDKTGGINNNGGSDFLTPYLSDSQSYSGVFPDAKTFNKQKVDGSYAGTLKESLGTALLSDESIRNAYSDLVSSTPDYFTTSGNENNPNLNSFFKNGVIADQEKFNTFLNKWADKIANMPGDEAALDLANKLGNGVSSDFEQNTRLKMEESKKYNEFIKKVDTYNKLVDNSLQGIIEKLNDDVAIVPLGHNFRNDNASSEYSNMNKEFKRVANRAVIEGSKDTKPESIESIFRFGTKVKFFGKEEKTNKDVIVDFDNSISKRKMIEYFNNPSMAIANDWDGFTVTGNKVFYTKDGKEQSKKLPEGLEVKTIIGENGKFVSALFDKEGKPIPIKYITNDVATNDNVSQYIEYVNAVPYQDVHYILKEIYKDPNNIKF